MAVLEISVVPIGTQSTSVSHYVAACQKILEQTEGITYQLNPMGTSIEGDLSKLLTLVQKLHEVPFEKGAQRVYTVVKIDDRRDKKASMQQKVTSVLEKL